MEGLSKLLQIGKLALLETYNVLFSADAQSFAGRIGEYFGDFECTVFDGRDSDSGSQVVLRDGEELVSNGVVKCGEDNSMYFPC